MNRRDFLKGTAAAGAAAVLPLSILKSEPIRYDKMARGERFDGAANSRWLQRQKFTIAHNIYEVRFERTRQGYGTGYPAKNYTPHADYYTASIIVSFMGFPGQPLGHYKYQIWEDPTTPGISTSGRRYFLPGEPYVSWCEDPHITMEEAEDHFWIAEFLALGYFRARGNRSQGHYDQHIKDLRECTFDGRNPLWLDGMEKYPIAREDAMFKCFEACGPDEILIGKSVYPE